MYLKMECCDKGPITEITLRSKLDGTNTSFGRLVKGPILNQYARTVPSTFQLLYMTCMVNWILPQSRMQKLVANEGLV